MKLQEYLGCFCFMYLGSQVADDGGCERDAVYRMNEAYRAWGTLKGVLSNRGLRINAKKCPYEGVIVRSRGMGYEKCLEKESDCS